MSTKKTLSKNQTLLELRKTLAWMDLVLTTLEEGVCVVDSSGQISYVNDSIVSMVGVSRVSLLAKKFLKVFPLAIYQGESSKKLSSTWSSKNAQALNDVFYLKLESKNLVTKLTSKYFKELSQTVIVIRDITTQVESEQKIKKQIEVVERMNRLMTGRELKMIELKKEINQLKKTKN